VHAQFSAIQNDPDTQFKSAKELFQKEQFSLAFPVFKNLVMHSPDNSNIPTLISEECRYYYVLCGLLLHDPSVEAAALSYIQFENNAARIAMLRFHLGEYYFSQHNFSAALGIYEKTNPENLSPNELASMKFHQGYGYFVIQQFTKAKPLFDVVRQIKADPNYIDANYSDIEDDMNRRNSTAKRHSPIAHENESETDNTKTRKKREELSVSACKCIKKETVQIIVKFN
jgi:tetratricopeptide (TPR) repeat protein